MYNDGVMITNIDIDEALIAQAMEISGARTKREAVDRALREMIARAKRTRFRDMWGIAGPDAFWPDYDPNATNKDWALIKLASPVTLATLPIARR